MRPFFVLLVAALVNACTPSSNEATFQMGMVYDAPRFGDVQPVSWPGIRPDQFPVHGIDVSKYQGDIDWHTVGRSGVSFAFIKATEGGNHRDRKFRQNWYGAAQAGIPRGAYHFYYLCRSAEDQARWFIENVPREAGTLPPVLDMEWYHDSKRCKYKPSAHHIRSEMRIFLQMVGQFYGKAPIIYTTVDFYKDNSLGLIRDHEFWLRSVADHPSSVYPGQPWSFWQYTGTGVIPGIEGKTDINVFAGSVPMWQQWFGYRAAY